MWILPFGWHTVIFWTYSTASFVHLAADFAKFVVVPTRSTILLKNLFASDPRRYLPQILAALIDLANLAYDPNRKL